MFDRRKFLKDTGVIAGSTMPFVAPRLTMADEASNDRRILVVVQLSGGNDGINTVVPFTDEGYSKHRRTLRLPTNRLLKLTDQLGLHPAMRPIASMIENGRMCVVQGVGYPDPNRSHGASMTNWQTARFHPAEQQSYGWAGRALDKVADSRKGSDLDAVLIGNEEMPIALRGRRSRAVALQNISDLQSNVSADDWAIRRHDIATDDLLAFAHRTAADAQLMAAAIRNVQSHSAPRSLYPSTRLGQRMNSIAELIKSDLGAMVYYAIQPDYDTHAAQLPVQQRLLGELSDALHAFHDDMDAAGLGDRVASLCFSEFGRRVKENASLGTDHGTAGPVFIGGPVATPFVGTTPSLTDLDRGDLRMHVDFRQVYTTVLEDWLGISATESVGGTFDKLACFA